MKNNLVKYLLQHKNKILLNTDVFSFDTEQSIIKNHVASNIAIHNTNFFFDFKGGYITTRVQFIFTHHRIYDFVYVSIKNKVANSFGTISFRKTILYRNSIGKLNSAHKEEKFGNWLLSKKLQKFLLVHKFKNPYKIQYMIVFSIGIRRFFRASLGHLTQMVIKLVKRYQYALYRYNKWLLKFMRIIRRLKRPIMLTYRQRCHGTWLKYNILNRQRQIIILYQVRLLTSYSNNIPKVRKRKGKFNFGY